MPAECLVRVMNARGRRGAGGARARIVLERALKGWARQGTRVDVGRVTKVGDGLSRELFAAEVEMSGPGSTQTGTYAVTWPPGPPCARTGFVSLTHLKIKGIASMGAAAPAAQTPSKRPAKR